MCLAAPAARSDADRARFSPTPPPTPRPPSGASCDAVARPARSRTSQRPEAPEGLDVAAGAVALTLSSTFETPVWLDPSSGAARRKTGVRSPLRGCPIVEAPAAAAFAMVSDPTTCPPLSHFNPGDAKYRGPLHHPGDPGFCPGGRAERLLSGPGLKERAAIAPTGLPEGFWPQVLANNARFQFGVDQLFVAGAC